MVITASTALRLAGVLLILQLASCATTPAAYDPIADENFKGPLLKLVLTDPQAYVNTRVRWGGGIARVENRRDETLIEVIEHRLDDNGRPYASGDSDGRFIARFAGFLDPAVYTANKQITVAGTVTGSTQRTIGEYPYAYPVVNVEQHRLWPERREPDTIYYYDPFWRSPWYDPWYPYPYYRYYAPRRRSSR